MPKPEVGARAPDVTLLDAAGQKVRLSWYWRERPAVAVFLRHWG